MISIHFMKSDANILKLMIVPVDDALEPEQAGNADEPWNGPLINSKPRRNSTKFNPCSSGSRDQLMFVRQALAGTCPGGSRASEIKLLEGISYA